MAGARKDWKKKPGVRAVVVDDMGRLLMLLRPEDNELFGGYWNLPGGGKEPGESYLEGARRELVEETGLDATPTGAGMQFFFPGGQGRAYLMRHPAGTLRIAPRESVQAKWFYPDELPAKLMPPTADIVRELVGSHGPEEGEGLMADLTLTLQRRAVESWAERLFKAWLEAYVPAIARRMALVKGIRTEEDEQMRRMTYLGNEPGDRAFVLNMVGTDAEGEAVSMRVLERAAKLGRSEAAKAILSDAKGGTLPHGRVEGYKARTIERLRSLARKNVRLIRETTERRLAALGAEPEAADVATLIQKLCDLNRAHNCAVNTVAGGYVRGVVDVLRTHGYRYVYWRTMGDEKVCPVCAPKEGTRMTILQALATFPYHVHCRCYPHPSPVAPLAPLNWRATNTARITKSLVPVTLPPRRSAMSSQTMLLALRVLAGDQADTDTLMKSLTSGLVPELPAERVMDVDTVLKSLTAIANGPKGNPDKNPMLSPAPGDDITGQKAAKQAAKAQQKQAMAKTSVPTDSPDHLVQAATQMLEQLRQLPPGSPEHAHLAEQYHAVREAVRGFHKAKGKTSSSSARGQAVQLPPPPAFVHGGAPALTNPRQFEVAVAQAQSREDAIDLFHYFDAFQRQGHHAGPQWDAAYDEIKQAIKGLPGAGGDAPITTKQAMAAKPPEPGEAGDLDAPKDPAHRGKRPLPGQPGYTEHFQARIQNAAKQDQQLAKQQQAIAKEKEAGQAKPAAKPEPKAKRKGAPAKPIPTPAAAAIAGGAR